MSDRPPVKLEIDGRPVEVESGATVMEAAQKLDIYVPHFCWHRKLTIAANCRMCLVQVEKAPKPLPACATPVTEGMKVWTHSDAAIDAQKGVMEFLLINHPLDCPICDQGGECQLQDLAVGYGASNSRYLEPKRVVLNKNLGPLISTDMTRCIHCTRCVRFGQEIAGVMELGMIGRGENAEIITFIGKTVDSEISGNVIDLCPVGALTSKPFRYTARTWELARRKSVSPHDSLGSNLIVQVKNERVMRVVPRENDAINECWLSDKDRFSYEGVNSDDRLVQPMVKRDGRWVETAWPAALEHVAGELKRIRDAHGPEAIGGLVSPHSTLEEMHLAQKLVRGLGSDNVDFRLRRSDFSDGKRDGATWLGMPVADIASLDRVLVVGSFLRKDHPLLAHRLRQRAKKGAEISFVHVADDEPLIGIAHKAIVAPSGLARTLAEIAVAAAAAAGRDAPSALSAIEPSGTAKAIAASLAGGGESSRRAVFLGSFAEWHPKASHLHALAQAIAEATGATLGFLGEAANSIGGTIAGALPRNGGLDASAMLSTPRKAYLVLHADPLLDTANPAATREALRSAELVVALSPFKSGGLDCANVLLPVAPFTETAGTFVSCEGRSQAFGGVVQPLAQARPAWKVLRVLGSMLGLPGFDFETIDAVRAELPRPDEIASRLSNATKAPVEAPAGASNGLERIADVPIYAADPLVRRAPSLQKTRDAEPPRARMHPSMLARLGIAEGAQARVRQNGYEAILTLAADSGTPEGCVRVSAAHPSTAALGPMFGSIEIEAA